MEAKGTRPKRSRRFRLLVVCASPEVRRRLASLAKELPFPVVVAEARDGREARTYCLNRRADVVLLDLHLSLADGLATMQTIRDKMPSVKIVLLASSSNDISSKRALSAGSNGVLRQHATIEELAGCLHPLLDGQDSGEGSPETQRKFILTKRELQILHLIDSRFKNKDIGERLSITEGTVKIHVHAILAKLGANSRREAISKARSYGLMASW